MLYISGIIQPIIFWLGIGLTLSYLGLRSFAYFKFLAFFVETIFYTVIIFRFLELKPLRFLKDVIVPFILPLMVTIFSTMIIKDYLPLEMGPEKLASYFALVSIPIILGFVTYYFTSKVFRKYFKKVLSSLIPRLAET